MFLGSLLVLMSYLIPILVTTALDDDWDSYGDGHYTEVAEKTAGVALTVVCFP